MLDRAAPTVGRSVMLRGAWRNAEPSATVALRRPLDATTLLDSDFDWYRRGITFCDNKFALCLLSKNAQIILNTTSSSSCPNLTLFRAGTTRVLLPPLPPPLQHGSKTML